MATLICGIDCGLSGAICLMCDGEVTEISDMPTLTLSRNGKTKREIDAHLLADWLERARPAHVFVEAVGAMPGQGTSSVFAFGKGYGVIIGILAALDLPVTLVPPQRWKRALGVKADKDAARARASQLMPSAAHHWPLKKHDGRAESAMICLFGWQSMARAAA